MFSHGQDFAVRLRQRKYVVRNTSRAKGRERRRWCDRDILKADSPLQGWVQHLVAVEELGLVQLGCSRARPLWERSQALVSSSPPTSQKMAPI